MGRVRRAGSRLVVVLAFVAIAAGTAGDIPSLLHRVRPGDAFAEQSVQTTSPSTSTTQRPPSTTSSTTQPPASAEWTLYAGGDVLMDRSEPAGRDPFAQLVPSLTDADLALVNVEMAITESGTAEEGKEFTFRAPVSAAETIARAGIDVGNLGNNHALDFGPDALVETARNLRDAGVVPVGGGADTGEAYAPATFSVGERGSPVSVAVLGASAVVPAGWPASIGAPGIATTRGDALVEAVRAAAEAHDVVVVTVHWGTENAPCPNDAQRRIADDLVDAGANVVIGHHPHVLQPVEERGGAVVAWSLGNFVWHPRAGPQADTGVLEIRFVGDRVDGFTFHPHVIDDRGEPVPSSPDDEARVASEVAPESCAD